MGFQGAPHSQGALALSRELLTGSSYSLQELFSLFPSAPSSSFLYRPIPLPGGRGVISTPTSYHSLSPLPALHKQIHSFQSIDLRKGWTLKTNLFFGAEYWGGGTYTPRSVFLPPSIYC